MTTLRAAQGRDTAKVITTTFAHAACAPSCVVALIGRDGEVRVPTVPNVTGKTLKEAIRQHVDPSATIYTDGFASYTGIGNDFAGGHEKVNRGAGEYARGDVHVNNCESFFGLLKLGLIGAFHHVSKEHLPRFIEEFAFRWNGRALKDVERTRKAIGPADGKRLTLRKIKGSD